MEQSVDVKKLGILGGTFDPIHTGHLQLARQFQQALQLDLVLLVPAWQPPHKRDREIVPGNHRLAMCQLACEGQEAIAASDIELRNRISYTADTLDLLGKGYPEAEIFLLLGPDVFPWVCGWKGAPKIASQVCLCAPYSEDTSPASFRRTAERWSEIGGRSVLVKMHLSSISSSVIRDALQRGTVPGEALPPGVLDYILKNKLYNTNPKYISYEN